MPTMTNATFLWKNLWDTGTLTRSLQHSSFPATNTRHRHHTRVWRSNYGAGSSWGTFVIEAGVNDKINFEETAAAELTATLTPGNYTAVSLCAQIKAQLETAGASTYTVEYLDAGNKFKLTSNGAGGGGIFSLLWNSGTNSATSVGTTIGFDVSADDTGSLTYTADNIRIHSEEWLKVDLGSAQEIKVFAFKKHNFQGLAQVRIQGHASDAWGSPSFNQLLGLTADITIYFFITPQTYQWWRYYIKDVDNPAGYTETGRCFLGSYFNPTINCRRAFIGDFIDPSDTLFSDGGQITANLKEKFKRTSYVFEYAVAADLASFQEIFDAVGRPGNWFFTMDRSQASTTTRYVHFVKDIRWKHIIRDELYTVQIVIEDLR